MRLRELIEQAHTPEIRSSLRPMPGLPKPGESLDMWQAAEEYHRAGLTVEVTLDGQPCIPIKHFMELDSAVRNEQDRADAYRRRYDSLSVTFTWTCMLLVVLLWTCVYLIATKGA